MTILETAKSTMKIQQRMVLSLSNITEMEYNTFQYQLGLDVLNSHIVNDENIRCLERDKNYWNWFKVHCYEHERAVVQFLTRKQEFDFLDYRRKMIELVESRRTVLSFQQFLTLFKYIR